MRVRNPAIAASGCGLQVLLDWLATTTPVLQSTVPPDDASFLRSLPIYPTLVAGSTAPLQPTTSDAQGCAGVCSREVAVAVFGIMEAMPGGLKVGLK